MKREETEADLSSSAQLTGNVRLVSAISTQNRRKIGILDKGQWRLGLDAQCAEHDNGASKGCRSCVWYIEFSVFFFFRLDFLPSFFLLFVFVLQTNAARQTPTKGKPLPLYF